MPQIDGPVSEYVGNIKDAYIAGAEWQKSQMIEHIKLAYGKVSMNPFDCSEAFEELITKIESL